MKRGCGWWEANQQRVAQSRLLFRGRGRGDAAHSRGACAEKQSLKRGGEFEREELNGSAIVLTAPPDELLAVNDACRRVSVEDRLRRLSW